MDDFEIDLLAVDLLERSDKRLERALHVAFEDDLRTLLLAFREAGEEILERRRAAAPRACACADRLSRSWLSCRGVALAFHDQQFVARIRQAAETQNLARRATDRRSSSACRVSLISDFTLPL